MPRGRPQKHQTLNFLPRHHGEHPVHLKENGQNEKQSDAVAKTNERKRSCSTESTTEGSESNNFTLERRGTAELGTKNGKEFNSESLNADPENSDEKEKQNVAAVNSIQKDFLTEVTLENSDVNSDDQPFTLRGYKRRRRNLMKWSDEEKQVTEKFFRRHINLRISPKKREVLQLIKLHPKLFKDRKWDVIKVYVCNKYNSKSKSMALSPVQTDSIDLESDGMSCDSARRKEIE
ncbi:uncharacterized protein LOC108739535 isoform X3 [Agrilus planipennis]|uniref:Uncharacterized protein LOC108739535 isoform X3 n=1 Tax=Agrilus planipennis TaxID=224129 RepID=A0A7F5RDP6_AGRPL|nr:uncharacterized protein LOC108739535 isoform X3 [Agrilus planipennis]XP_025834102.1 uncharacterized protein LOC108739535 isoform X3 [Agrilus planipennis]